MNTIITQAITNKQRLKVTYNGTERLVEPHTYGLDKNGKGKVRVYQIAEATEHQGWRLLNESEITEVEVAGDNFAAPQSGYQADDKHIPTIIAQL